MSLLSINYPGIIEPFRHCKNALYPDAAFYADAHAGLNHCLVYRGKEVFRRSNVLGNLATGFDTSAVTWRWYFHSGYGQTQLQIVGVLGLGYDSGGIGPATGDPTLTVSVTKAGGATTTTDVRGGQTTATPVDSPTQWIPFETTIAIDPASDYYCELQSNDFVRVLSLMARTHGEAEVDDSVSYYTEHEPAGTHPIYDANQQRLIEGTGNLLRRNKALQANWCLFNGAARTRTANTWVNLIDNSSASPPTSTSPGWRFVTTARNTASRTTIPVVMAVYADSTDEGQVTLRNTGGTDVVTVDIDTSGPQWFTGSGSISVGAGEKYDPGFISNGVATLSVWAISIFEYET